MQTKAVIKAALAVNARHPEWNIVPEIMIPLVGEVKELKFVKDVVVKAADAIIAEAGSDMKYLVGTMIEIPIQRIYLISDLIVLGLSLSYIPVRRIGYSLLTVVLSGQIIGWIQLIPVSRKANPNSIEQN